MFKWTLQKGRRNGWSEVGGAFSGVGVCQHGQEEEQEQEGDSPHGVNEPTSACRSTVG
jgi:hypothetical protein